MGKVVGIKAAAKAVGTSRGRAKAEGSVVGAYARAGKRQAVFVTTLAETCNVSASARAAGVAASTCYRWRAQDAAFAAAWDTALAVGYDRLEAALLDYALERVERGTVDPKAVLPEEVKGSIATAVAQRCVSHADLQFAVGMLSRHRAAGEGKTAGARKAAGSREPVSRREADAALRRALDGIARRVKPA